jgi:hypothetical protein
MVNGLHHGACKGYQAQVTSFYKLKSNAYSGGNEALIIAVPRAGMNQPQLSSCLATVYGSFTW